MKKLIYVLLFVLIAGATFAQGSTCASAAPFCSGSGVIFPNTSSGVIAQTGPSYGCLSTRPNPAWYYMQIGSPGTVVMTISQTSNSGNPIDVDFIVWGPYTSMANMCTNLTGSCSGSHNCSGNIVDCSYSTAAVETATIPNAQAGQYYMVLITNYNGAPGTINFSQTGGSGTSSCSVLYPCLAFAGNDTSICIGQSLTLGAVPAATGNGNISYSWSPTTGLSNPNSPNPIATPTQTTTYFLTMIDDSLCTATDSIIVNVRNPIANAGVDDTLTCQDITVNLNGAASTSGVYTWTSIGGSVISGANTTTPLVGQTGLYIITVNQFGCLDTDTVQIFQDASLPIVLSGNDTSITCAVDTIQLSGFVSGPNLQYYWTGPSIISGGSTLSPMVNGVGSYVLTARDTINNCQMSSTVNVFDERTPPTVAVGSSSNITCLIQSVTLSGNGSATGSNIGYQWTTTGNGLITSGTQSISASTNTAGTYTLTVYDSLTGCFGSNNIVVLKDTLLPIASAGVDTSLNCLAVGFVALNGMGSASGFNITYLWSTINGNIVVAGNTNYPLVDQPGNYVITVTNTTNGCVNTDEVVVVHDTLRPIANSGVDTTLNCYNPVIALNGSQSSVGLNFSYQWTGPFLQSGANSINPVVNGAGKYFLVVTNTSNECTNMDSVVVSSDFTKPGANAGARDTICLNEEVTLNGSSPSSGAQFLWTTSDGNIFSGANTFNPVVTEGGSYLLTTTNPINGCKDTASVFIYEPIVTAIISANPTSGVLPLTVSFVNLGVADSSYWNFGNGQAYGSSSNPSLYNVVYNEQGNFTVWLTSYSSQCPDSQQILIEVIGQSNLDSIPTIFTPNGDGKNDVFEFVHKQNIVELNCHIFNRWGKLIMEISSPEGFWDGKINGMDAAVGTYFYGIKAVGGDEVNYDLKGTVTLLR